MKRSLHSYLIVTALFAASVTAAAPVVQTLEDFEGRLTGWGGKTQIVAQASQGEGALEWIPDSGAGPKAANFNFAGRGIEMSDWDRLTFDYRLDGTTCEWWGVKIVDWPLGDGMQATWQIASKGDVPAGQWRTAAINLGTPQWLWGDKPDEKSQLIMFRAQFTDGKAHPVLIDNIRLERDPLRIQKVERGESVTEGDRLRLGYRITLANTTQAAATFATSLSDTDDHLQVTVPDSVEIAPAASAEVEISLSAPISGPEAAAPLSVLTTRVSFSPPGESDTAMSVELSLPVPLKTVKHPCLLITREQAAEVLAKVARDPKAEAIYKGLVARADAWLTKEIKYPDRGSQWWHWYTCKKCGGRLNTKSPTEHVCPDCGASYTGWPYDDVVLDREHNALSQAIRDLGLVYVFTGERKYAERAREILLGYAERYLNYPLHDINGKPNRGGGHVGPQTLDESTWLIPLVQGFDCVYDTLSPEDVEQIATKMLIPAAELIHDHQWGIHNICCWHDSAYGLVGIALADERFAGDAINGPKGFKAQIEKGVTDDGFWYESAWGYHFYTMMALEPLAIAARNIGINLYTDRYKGMYDAPLAFMGPGGVLPAFNDSGTANALGGGNRYEIAYARWQDPRHLLPILSSSRNSLETLLFGVELGAQEEFRLESALFPAAGYAVLRSGRTGEKGADRYVPHNYLALDYGPHGGGHGHPDKLGFVLYGHGTLLAEDPGCIAYGNPAHGGWFRQTISHNTVVVDGKSQKPCTGTLQFFAAADNMAVASARADEAYGGVRLRRTMALVGDRVIDVVLCESEDERTFDWAYHNRGALETPVALSALEKAPAGDGYDWAKEWRAGEIGADWSALWRQEGGPGLKLAQTVAEGRAQLLSAIGMGNPTKIKVPFVISRVTGRKALYATALEVFGGDAPELSVRSLPIRSASQSDPDEQPVAVEATGGATRDILLINPGGGTIAAEDFELRGQGAVLRYMAGKLQQVLVTGDGEVLIAGQPAAGQ